jgi:hypothetical protein
MISSLRETIKKSDNLMSEKMELDLRLKTDNGKPLYDDKFYYYNFEGHVFKGKYLKIKKVFLTDIYTENPIEHSALKCNKIEVVKDIIGL